MEHIVLFRTVHGSRLYGLAHADSDYDYFTVVDRVKKNKKRYATHTIIGDYDSVVVDFGTFVQGCAGGVPQYLEAMFSTMAEVDDIAAFRSGFRATSESWDRYLRTIKSFAMQDDFKHKRHALRLALNLRGLRAKGRFNPTLDPKRAALINRAAQAPAEEVYDFALRLAWG